MTRTRTTTTSTTRTATRTVTREELEVGLNDGDAGLSTNEENVIRMTDSLSVDGGTELEFFTRYDDSLAEKLAQLEAHALSHGVGSRVAKKAKIIAKLKNPNA